LPIFWPKCGGALDMNCASLQVKPVWTGFDNLGFSHPSMKAAKQRELQIVTRAFSDQFVALCKCAEFLSSHGIDARQFDRCDDICSHLARFEKPVKETPQSSDVSLIRRLSHALADVIVEPLYC